MKWTDLTRARCLNVHLWTRWLIQIFRFKPYLQKDFWGDLSGFFFSSIYLGVTYCLTVYNTFLQPSNVLSSWCCKRAGCQCTTDTHYTFASLCRARDSSCRRGMMQSPSCVSRSNFLCTVVYFPKMKTKHKTCLPWLQKCPAVRSLQFSVWLECHRPWKSSDNPGNVRPTYCQTAGALAVLL